MDRTTRLHRWSPAAQKRRRGGGVVFYLLVLSLLACLATPTLSEGGAVGHFPKGHFPKVDTGARVLVEDVLLLGHLGPVGVDPREIPPLALVHPLVVACLQLLVSLMALIAFPVRRAAATATPAVVANSSDDGSAGSTRSA